MNDAQAVGAARKVLSVRRVFGEPIECDGVTIIPVARINGRGAGRSDGANGDGSKRGKGGGAFRVKARPSGAFVVRDGKVTWQPAVDVNRIVAGGQVVGVIGMLTYAVWSRVRSRRSSRR